MSDLIDLPRIGTGVTMPQMQLKRAVGRIVVRNTAPGFILDGITTVTNVAKSSRLHNLTETLEQNIGVENLVEYRGDNSYISDIVETDELCGKNNNGG